MRRMTSEQHYRMAEKLLRDEEISHEICSAKTDSVAAAQQRTSSLEANGRLREIVLIHATLASAGITQADVDRMDAEDEDEMARLCAASGHTH